MRNAKSHNVLRVHQIVLVPEARTLSFEAPRRLCSLSRLHPTYCIYITTQRLHTASESTAIL